MPTNILPILPIIFPLIAAIVMLSLWRHYRMQRTVNVISSIINLGVAITLFAETLKFDLLVFYSGGWVAPFGITLVSDTLSSVMVLISAVILFVISIYSLSSIDERRQSFGYFPLIYFMIVGINGAFLTGDIFNLYVWFEVMLISSFVLLVLGGEKRQIEGALKYVTLNLIASIFFLTGVGIMYGITGSLNMAEIALKIRVLEDYNLISMAAMFFLVSFGIKAAVFPLFFWLPASYHTPPIAVSAIFAGLLTKVGVYCIIRFFTLIFVTDVGHTHTIILVIAVLTMVTGVLGAASQFDFRRVLSFHIVSQIGYMILGLALFTPLAITGAIFYIIHHIIVKTNLFLVSGIVYKLRGSYNLKKLGGLYNTIPFLGFLFLIPALSLAGIPPLSGFWAKFTVVKASIDKSEIFVAVIALLVGLMTLYSMIKIWNEAFWKPQPDVEDESKLQKLVFDSKNIKLIFPVLFLIAITLYISFNPGVVYDLSLKSATELLDPEIYISKVLNR